MVKALKMLAANKKSVFSAIAFPGQTLEGADSDFVLSTQKGKATPSSKAERIVKRFHQYACVIV